MFRAALYCEPSLIQNFHVGDFDPLSYLQVIGKKVSLHCMKSRFSVIFSITIRYLQIPNMAVLDTYIRNLYANIYASSFKAALPPGLFSCFYMFGDNAYTFVRTNRILSSLASNER